MANPSLPVSVPDLTLAEDGRFRFSSPIQTASLCNNTVLGRLFKAADPWQERPTVILLHGWNAELCYRYQFPFLASRLRRYGINTAAIELPYHMHRRPLRGPVTDFISSDLNAMLEATRQAIADARALGLWLRAQGSASIGVWGFSLGAWLAGLTARVEPDLRFAVLTTPIARMDQAIAQLPFCEPVRQSLNGRPVDLHDLNLASRVPSLDPRNILLVESLHDLFAPPETIEQLWEAWRHPEIWRVAHGHITVLMSLRVTARTVRWIHSRISG
ncbi:MAG: alpha/beta hydrolase [Verrucomicrobiia bacterium]